MCIFVCYTSHTYTRHVFCVFAMLDPNESNALKFG